MPGACADWMARVIWTSPGRYMPRRAQNVISVATTTPTEKAAFSRPSDGDWCGVHNRISFYLTAKLLSPEEGPLGLADNVLSLFTVWKAEAIRYTFVFVSFLDFYEELMKLLLIDARWSAGHRIRGGFRLWEGDDLSDVALPAKRAAVRSMPIAMPP